jgi:hypothetical protein
MRAHVVPTVALILASTSVQAQEIVEVPEDKANVSRPDDLFDLSPGQWHMSKMLSAGSEPCTSDQCEAGFNGGDLVVSVEHAKDFVRIIAGFRGCERTAYSEVEVGLKPGKSTFRRVSKQVERVVKALGKTCKLKGPAVPAIDVAMMFRKQVDNNRSAAPQSGQIE